MRALLTNYKSAHARAKQNKKTPLHIAAESGRLEALRALLAADRPEFLRLLTAAACCRGSSLILAKDVSALSHSTILELHCGRVQNRFCSCIPTWLSS